MESVTDATFEAEVLKSDKPVLVDFWADWCVPCRKIESALNEIAAGNPVGEQVKMVKMDIESNPETSRSYSVLTVPTLAMFKDGEQVNMIMGSRPKSELVKFIETAL